jgi:ribosome-associated toxin RatA of RatAB toxin-antitoxin module
MGKVEGSASTEIEAPIDAVYAVASDVEGSRRWQPELEVVKCTERDIQGNQVLVHMETDTKVRRFNSKIRFSYEEPNRVSWVQEEGDLKAVEGSWELEDLGDGRTRATYWLEVDPGRKFGLIVRGPVVDVLRGKLVDSAPGKLKRFIETDSA